MTIKDSKNTDVTQLLSSSFLIDLQPDGIDTPTINSSEADQISKINKQTACTQFRRPLFLQYIYFANNEEGNSLLV